MRDRSIVVLIDSIHSLEEGGPVALLGRLSLQEAVDAFLLFLGVGSGDITPESQDDAAASPGVFKALAFKVNHLNPPLWRVPRVK